MMEGDLGIFYGSNFYTIFPMLLFFFFKNCGIILKRCLLTGSNFDAVRFELMPEKRMMIDVNTTKTYLTKGRKYIATNALIFDAEFFIQK